MEEIKYKAPKRKKKNSYKTKEKPTWRKQGGQGLKQRKRKKKARKPIENEK